MSVAKIRLYLPHPLGAGQSVPLTEGQAHYLGAVMRLAPGAPVLGFDGANGEWLCRVEALSKRGGVLRAESQTRPQAAPSDLWLLFAPIKKARMDFLIEKSVELGVARLVPVSTDYTNAERLRRDRIEAQIIEAAEQCGATHLPELADLAPLSRALDGWASERRLLWADETLANSGQATALPPAPAALLIGPEGGFSPRERERLRALPFLAPLRLGPRILRAETAALAALTLWQAQRGDWQ